VTYFSLIERHYLTVESELIGCLRKEVVIIGVDLYLTGRQYV